MQHQKSRARTNLGPEPTSSQNQSQSRTNSEPEPISGQNQSRARTNLEPEPISGQNHSGARNQSLASHLCIISSNCLFIYLWAWFCSCFMVIKFFFKLYVHFMCKLLCILIPKNKQLARKYCESYKPVSQCIVN